MSAVASRGRPEGAGAGPPAPSGATGSGRTEPRKSKVKSSKPGAGIQGSGDAKRRASLVLEVLSGLRTPLDASVLMAVSLQRYYLLESRAVQGLVAALEPVAAGRRSTEAGALSRLQRERDRLARELLRAQALIRVAQRTMGVAPPQLPGRKAESGKRRSAKAPSVRARRVVSRLREDAAADAAPPPASTGLPDGGAGSGGTATSAREVQR